MNSVLLRQDPVFGRLPGLLVTTLSLGVVIRLLLEVSNFRGAVAGEFTLVFEVMGLLVWIMPSLYAADGSEGSVQTRGFEFLRALPVTAGELTRTRLKLFLAIGLLPLGLMTLLLWPLHLSGVRQHALLHLSAALTWAAWVGMCFMVQPSLSRLRSRPLYLLCTLIAGALGVYGFSAPEVVVPISGLLALATLSYTFSRRRLRFSEWVQPKLPPAAQRYMANGQPVLPTPPTLSGWFIQGAISVPSTIQVLVGGAFSAALAGSMTIMSLLIVPVGVEAFIRHADPLLNQMGALPISRRVIARWVLLPPLALLVIGTFLGESARRALHVPELEAIRFDSEVVRGSSELRLVVPERLMRLQVGSGTTEIEAPWGEVARVAPIRMGKNLPNVYAINPYGVAVDSSLKFLAWQFSHAIRDTYGIDVSLAELQALCPAEGSAEEYGLQLNLLLDGEFFEQHGDPRLSSFEDLFETSLILAIFLWAMTSWWATRLQLPDRSGRRWLAWLRRQSGQAPIYVGSLAFVVSLVVPNWLAPAPVQALARELQRSPVVAHGVLWVAIALSTWAMFSLLARRYERMQPPLVLKSTWIRHPLYTRRLPARAGRPIG